MEEKKEEEKKYVFLGKSMEICYRFHLEILSRYINPKL